jgi:hypothetical protein
MGLCAYHSLHMRRRTAPDSRYRTAIAVAAGTHRTRQAEGVNFSLVLCAAIGPLDRILSGCCKSAYVKAFMLYV